MTSKIKAKVGIIEIEFEGSEEFILNELFSFVERLSGLIDSNPSIRQNNQVPTTTVSDRKEDIINNKGIQGTTNAISAKLKVSSGTELIMAAAAHLTFVKGEDKFHRKDLLEQCQSAATYYKQSYSGNFSRYLSSLVKSGQLTEQASGIFAIPAAQRQRMEIALAD
ncbi:hypothetical protein ACFO0S_06845 [Chryseomicrobium palamuruense]|uniref:Uncharacterized protein n=1 Tax=Chryseomicrobium palamuruense TaxID=682973 RepID=A0ABV8UWF7_9BACL